MHNSPHNSPHNSLHHPCDPDHSAEENFSPVVAEALAQAYRTIKLHQGGLPGQLGAQALVGPLAGAIMSRRQRMQVYYVQAMAALAQGDYPVCTSLLGAAGDLASRLPDLLAGAELAYLHAVAEVMRHRYAIARDHYARSLDLLIAARGGDLGAPSPDPEIEVSAILGAAGCDFLTARYGEAQRYVALAQSLLPPAPKPLTAGTAAWLQASLDRWRGETAQALHTALAAAEVFAASGNPGNTGQLLLLAALCALDLAEPAADAQPVEDSVVSTSWLPMAQPLIERTLRHARATSDAALEGHALLARARYDRLTDPPAPARPDTADPTDTVDPVDRMGALAAEAIAVRAQRLHDPVLMCEAITERGHQLEAQGEIAAAISSYTEAVAHARSYGVPALGVWARRALERLSRAGYPTGDAP